MDVATHVRLVEGGLGGYKCQSGAPRADLADNYVLPALNNMAGFVVGKLARLGTPTAFGLSICINAVEDKAEPVAGGVLMRKVRQSPRHNTKMVVPCDHWLGLGRVSRSMRHKTAK